MIYVTVRNDHDGTTTRYRCRNAETARAVVDHFYVITGRTAWIG